MVPGNTAHSQHCLPPKALATLLVHKLPSLLGDMNTDNNVTSSVWFGGMQEAAPGQYTDVALLQNVKS